MRNTALETQASKIQGDEQAEEKVNEALEKYDQEGWKAIFKIKLAEKWHKAQ